MSIFKSDSEVDSFDDIDNLEVERQQTYKVKEENVRNIPKNLKFEYPITKIDFHPDNDIFLVSLSSGCIKVFDYSVVTATRKTSDGKVFPDAMCTYSQFSDDGKSIFATSSKGSILQFDFPTFRPGNWSVPDAHSTSISYGLQCDDNTFSTGGSDGQIKIFDLRNNTKEPVVVFKDCLKDSITTFDFSERRDILYATSMDGRLGIFDLKKRKLVDVSGYAIKSASYVDGCEVNYGQSFACCTNDGALDLFFYGRWDRPAQRMSKHRKGSRRGMGKTGKSKFECVLFMKDEILASGHENGYIGLYDVSRSDKIVHVGGLGRFDNVRISEMALASDGKFLATANDEMKIRFWHTSFIFDGTKWWEDVEYYESDKKNKKRKREMDEFELDIKGQKKKKTKFNSKQKRFFADLTK